MIYVHAKHVAFQLLYSAFIDASQALYFYVDIDISRNGYSRPLRYLNEYSRVYEQSLIN